MSSHRFVEVLVGTALVGYCLYAVHSGYVFGRTRQYSRGQEPLKFWLVILVGLGCGAAFVYGAVSWR